MNLAGQFSSRTWWALMKIPIRKTKRGDHFASGDNRNNI